MPVNAVGFTCVVGEWTCPSKTIFAVRNKFEVIGVYATDNTAFVVKVALFSNPAMYHLVGEAMPKYVFPLSIKVRIASVIYRSGP